MYCGRQVHTGFCKTGVIRTKPETNPECPLYKRTDFIRKVEIWWIHKHGGTTGLCLSFKMKNRRIKMSPPPTLQIQNFTIKENRQIAKKNTLDPTFGAGCFVIRKKIRKRLQLSSGSNLRPHLLQLSWTAQPCHLGRQSNNQNGNLRWHLPLGVPPPPPP